MTPEERAERKARFDAQLARQRARADPEDIIVATEAAHNLHVEKRIDIVSSEVVFGMGPLQDLASGVCDTFGGRAVKMQRAIKDARKTAVEEIKQEAAKVGAGAVVGLHIEFQDVGKIGKMLMVVATGTAVTLKED